MKVIRLVPFALLAACSSGPSNGDALKMFAASSQAMTTAQNAAVEQARAQQQTPVAPRPAGNSLALSYSGACATGGTVAVTGTYDGDGTGAQAAFDVTVTFDGCAGGVGTLDGSLTWTSTATSTSFVATMTGSLSYADASTSFACDYDLTTSVAVSGAGSSASADLSYSGSLCGYDVNTQLHVGAGT